MIPKSVELDLRQLGMAERHSKIFNTWDSLSEGDSLIIVNDHDPSPLQYMLRAQAKGAFEWQYREEGPERWIVEIKKMSSGKALNLEKRDALKKMLKKLHEAKPEELDTIKVEAVKYFKDTDPKELALAEQELIQECTTRQEMKRLCDVHLEVMKEQLGVKAKALKLPAKII